MISTYFFTPRDCRRLLSCFVALILLIGGSVSVCAGSVPNPQHIVEEPENKTWTTEVTSPYVDESRYYGLYLDGGEYTGEWDYTVAAPITLGLEKLYSLSRVRVYGLLNTFTAGDIAITSPVSLDVAGWDSELEEEDKTNTSMFVVGVQDEYYYGCLLKVDADVIVNVNPGKVYTEIAGTSLTTDVDVFGIRSYGRLENSGRVSISCKGAVAGSDVEGVEGAYLNERSDVDVDVTGLRASDSIINQGNIQLTAEAGVIEADVTSSSTSAVGATLNYDADVYAQGIDGSRVINNGDITVDANGGNVHSILTMSNVNNQSVDVELDSDVEALGIGADNGVDNTGDINVNASAGSVDFTIALSSAVGTYKYYDIDASSCVTGIKYYHDDKRKMREESEAEYILHNTGDIRVTSRSGDLTLSLGSINSGSGDIDAYSEAVGIMSGGLDIENSGNITAVAKGSEEDVTVEGDVVYINNGVIACGIASEYLGSRVVNSGNVTASSYGHKITSASETQNFGEFVESYGIYAGGSIVNSGTITVTAEGGLVNTTRTSARAIGILMPMGGELSSTGLIQATASLNPDAPASGNDGIASACQVYSGGNLTIKKYAMEVGHSQSTFNKMYEGQVETGEGAEVTFADAELSVHLPADFKNGIYDIPRLWKQETEDQKAIQLNQFASVVEAKSIPDVYVSLIPSTSADKLQQIKLEYAPKESIPLKQALISLEMEGHIHSIIQDNLTSRLLWNMSPDTPQTNQSSSGIDGSTSTMVASLSNPGILSNITAESSKQHSLFFRPVYVNSYDCASSGYSSNTYGFVLGYNYKVYPDSNDALIGVHAGYTRGDVRFTGTRYSDTKEFVDTYYGGFHGATLLTDNILLSGEASFFYADSEVRDDNPAVLGKSDYDSVAIRAEVEVGYLWKIEGHSIIPEIGLDYSWQHRDSFTADNKNSPDIHYGTLDNNELYANARLKWLKCYDVSESCTITPLVGVGVTQVLTDGEFSNTMRLGNETQMVVDQDENTTFTPEANLTISSDDCYAMVGYTGGFGGTTHNNMFWLQMGYNF